MRGFWNINSRIGGDHFIMLQIDIDSLKPSECDHNQQTKNLQQ